MASHAIDEEWKKEGGKRTCSVRLECDTEHGNCDGLWIKSPKPFQENRGQEQIPKDKTEIDIEGYDEEEVLRKEMKRNDIWAKIH